MYKFSSLIVLFSIISILLIQNLDLDFLGEVRNTIFIFSVILLSYLIFFFKNILNGLSKFNKNNLNIFIYGAIVYAGSIFFSKAMNYFDYSVFFEYAYTAPVFLPLFLLICYLYSFYLEHDKLDLISRNTLLSGLIKIFYIPFLFGASIQSLDVLSSFNFIDFKLENYFEGLFYFGVLFDVMIGFSGYIVSSKLFNNKIIDVNDQWLGWFFCFLCYPPLISIYRIITTQQDNYIWTNWVKDNEPLYWIWAVILTLSWIVYWISTFAFGNKFSNLTWRGLIKEGPYRFHRHPAYLAKNIYWWMYTVPFFGVLFTEVIYNFMALCFVSFVYYMRATTEERHLKKFAEYQDYVLWIEKNSPWYRIKNSLFNCFNLSFFSSFYKK